MRLFKKQIPSLLLALAVLISTFAEMPFNGKSAFAAEQDHELLTDEFSAYGTSSFGDMFARSVSEAQQEQIENNGYNIFSIEVFGKTASAEFSVRDYCALSVAVYDEAGDTLLGMGTAIVSPEQSKTDIDIEIDNMPQYFYLRGFLTDSETLRPQSTVYESPMYTRNMQELLNKTTDDFAPDRVLDLDGNKDSNFAVYNDSVKIISIENGTNVITNVDRENNTYTFENAGDDITQLKPGDIFTYDHNGDILIVKVSAIVVDGVSVVVTGADTELEEVFDYLKIEEAPDTEAFDVSDVSDGISYTGIVEETDDTVAQNENGISPYSARVSIETGLKKEHSFDLNIGDNNTEITGSITFGIGGTLKAYISRSESYIELRVDYSITSDVHVSAAVNKITPICTFGFSPFLGVYIDFTPSFIVRVNAKIEFVASVEGTIGVRMGTCGFEDLTCAPDVKSNYDFDGSVYIGFSFEPKVKIISDDIAYIKLTAEVGGEIEGKIGRELIDVDKNARHSCSKCIDGDISVSAKISVEGSIWRDEDLTYTAKLIDVNEKLWDFYYSYDKDTGGFTECPYWTTRVTVRVTDEQGNPLKKAKAKYGGIDPKKILLSYPTDIKSVSKLYETAFTPVAEAVTDDKGVFSIMVNNRDFLGEVFIAEVSAKGYVTRKEVVELSHTQSSISVKLASNGTSKSKVSFAETSNKSPKKEITAKEVIAGGLNTSVITTDGTLYVSGEGAYHYEEWFEDQERLSKTYRSSTIPLKIAGHVISVSGESDMTAVTSDNILHTWGIVSEYGPKDNLFFNHGYTAKETKANSILSNAKSVVLKNQAPFAVITASDELLLCGSTGYSFDKIEYGKNPASNNGGIGKYSYFEKVIDNVAAIDTGDGRIAAVTNDGELYVWGHDYVGDGTKSIRTSPVKIMDNVASVCVGNDCNAAVTKSGELYMWGYAYSSGNFPMYPSVGHVLSPIKVMDNVSSVGLGGGSTAIVTNDGSLYMCGSNYYGVFGDGTTNGSKTPKKIMDDVVSVSMSSYHCAALKKDGSVWVWGYNKPGQLGNGTTTDSLVPIRFVIPQPPVSSSVVFSGATGNSATVSKLNAANTIQQADFRDLIPNTIYNFYALRSDTADELLSADNVLYITQAVSDDLGNLSVNYYSDQSVSDPVVFVKGMERIDIAEAQVYTFPRYTNADGTEVFAAPTIYYNDEPLTEGIDYTLDGEPSAETKGKYTVTINGKGDFRGSLSAEWELLSLDDDPFEEEKPDEPIKSFVNIEVALPENNPPDTSFRFIAAYRGETCAGIMGIDEDGSFDISELSDGKYEFTVYVGSCAPKSFNVTVANEKVSGLDDTVYLHLYGDMNGDGKINAADVLRAKLQARNPDPSSYDFAVANVNGDERVNSQDVLKIKLHARGTALLW